MSSVRTVTTVQTSGIPADSNLDALLEDLQTSVGRTHTTTVNGGAPGGRAKVYREVTRTVKHESKPGYQVEYLVPANTTTVVSERAPSPGMELINQAGGLAGSGVTAYKTTTIEYNTTKKTAKVLPETGYEYSPGQHLPEVTNYEYSTSNKSATMLPGQPTNYEYSQSRASSRLPSESSRVAVEDAGLRKNLTELDSLLVDLHHAQKVGFGGDQGGRGRSRSNEAAPLTRGGVDLGLLEPLDSSTPAPPSRGGQHVSRSTVQEQRTYQTYNTGSRDDRYQSEPSPRVQPKRASSVNRELIFNESNSSTPVEYAPHHRSTRSPSPQRRGAGEPDSPQVPRRKQQQVYYEKTTTTSSSAGSGRQPRSTSSPQTNERYRDKSPSNQRLQREVYGGDSRNNSVPASPRQERYQEMSPPSQRRNHSPSPVRSPDYPPNKSSSVRSYNYSTTSNTTTTSPRPYRSPSPIANRSPYVENAPIVELPRRSPSPKIVYQNNGPHQPPTKVTTTVRTYTYELPPGQAHPYPPGQAHPYPPGNNGYTVQEPGDYPDRPSTYQVTSHTHKEPEQPPTVISYKYSSHHSSHNSNTKYPHGEEPQHLQPRPFPTPSPQPGPNGEPPKKLEELMASFGDTEITQQRSGNPPGYFTSERHQTSTSDSRPQVPPHETNGVAVVAPSNVKPPAPPPGDGVRNRGNMKNVAGPPVYYPPGVELFAHKDQEAKMTSSKASGEYEAARESQSKGSSGGGAVVPVCLPLCCAMPCTII